MTGNRRKLSETIPIVRKLYRQGMSKADMARRLGVSRQRADKICNAAGLPKGHTAAGRKVMADAGRRTFLRLHAEGDSIRKKRVHIGRDAELLALSKSGLSVSEISGLVGLSRNTVIGALWREKKRAERIAPR